MTAKPNIKLVIFDADDTIWQAYKPWAACMEPAIRDLIDYLGADPEKLRHCIQNEAIGQHRFNDYGGLSHFLKKQGLIPEVSDPQGQYEREIIRRNIRSRFFHDWRKQTIFYPETIGFLRDLKKAGTTAAIWTDSDAPTVIRRFHSACKNLGYRTKEMKETLSLIDKFYVMPSAECDSLSLWDIDDEFIRAFKQRMVICADPKGWKPATPERTENGRGRAIMGDFKALPENTLMIGDSNKDVFAALQSGMHAAWYQNGSNHDGRTIAMLRQFASPRYKYGIEAIQEQLDLYLTRDDYTVLRKSLDELHDHFTFAPAEHAYRHSLLSRGCHIPLELLRPDQAGVRTRQGLNVLFGIATHFGEVFPVIDAQDPSDMADPEISGLLQAPNPA